ncbi:MAG: hypothetical protein ACI353_06250 [Alloprevotella sp.]
MASRKQLKKSIKSACGELMADCIALQLCNGATMEAYEPLKQRLVEIYKDYVARVSHPEPGNKHYYQALIESFTKGINATAEAIINA